MSAELDSLLAGERTQLRQLLDSHRTLIDSVASSPTPGPVECSALAALLHSFYTGLENAMRTIAIELDGHFAKTDSWHIDLLQSMGTPGPHRPALFNSDLIVVRREYLGFRHVFRSHYLFELNWARMQHLVESLPETHRCVELALDEFLRALSTRPS